MLNKPATLKEIVVAVAIFVFLRWPLMLLDHAVSGWVDDQIANAIGISSPTLESVGNFLWQWIVPLIGVAIVLFVYHRFVVARAPQAPEEKQRDVTPFASRVPATDSQAPAPIPDWSIRDLFFHIRPDLIEDPKSNLWEIVGLEVRDKLSTGQLKIWGRQRTNLGKRSAQAEIPSTYWAKVDFTYWFLAEGHEQAFHANPATALQLPGYSDLHVNQAQALKIWPKPLRVERDFISLKEAATRLYEEARGIDSIWSYAAERTGARATNSESSADQKLNYLATYIRRKIPIYGVSPPSRIRETIPSQHGVFKNAATEYRIGNSFFTQLEVTRDDLEKEIGNIKEGIKTTDSI